MPPHDEEVSGGKTTKNDKPSCGGMLAVYAEREKPSTKPLPTASDAAKTEDKGEVLDALTAATAPDEDWSGPPLTSGAGDATVSFSSESIPPGVIPSEVIDASEFVEDAPPKAAKDEKPEENPECMEYPRSVDNSGMREQFLAAGGMPSDLPPPPVEADTGASADENLKQEILNRLKIDLYLILPNSTPAKLLHKLNGVVFGDFWPPSEQDARRIVSLLFDAGIVFGQYDMKSLAMTPLDELKSLLKAELDLRRAKKSAAEPLPIQHKKRKGPPPLPRT